MAVTQIAKNGAGRAYYERRRAEGDAGSDALRRLKRKLCRLVYNRLRSDYARRTATPPPAPAPAPAVEDRVPAWLEMVELAASLDAARDARQGVDGERAATTDLAELDGDTDG
jgi:hypothetical protein